MTEFLKTLAKPGSTDWYSMASYGVPVQDMLSTLPGINLNVPQDVSGFSLPGVPDMPVTTNVLNQQPSGFWNSIGQGIKNSGIIGGTNPDGTKFDGWGATAVGLLQALNAFGMGNRQLKLSRAVADDARNQFAMNYGAQRQLLNTRMEDRQRARVGANPKNESVESYMARNRIN